MMVITYPAPINFTCHEIVTSRERNYLGPADMNPVLSVLCCMEVDGWVEVEVEDTKSSDKVPARS